MSFIPKSPISMTKLSTPPLPPPEGTRGLFATSDGWYEIDDQGTVRKIGGNDEAEDYELFKYYNSTDITPSDESLFVFSNGSVKSASEDISGDIVIPYKYTLDKKEYIINRIGEEAFFNCSNLTNVIIPNSIVRIRDNAFYNCKGLTKVVIPDSVIQIDDWAFEECSLLKEVTLSENISIIALSAFKGCSNLTDVYYKGSPEDWNLVQIGSGNEALLNANIHYNWKNVTQGYVDEKIKELIGAAPEALDTLKELSEALGDDPNFATTVLTEIGKKVDKVDGKGLSTNDFTNELKAKLEGLEKIEIDTELNSQSSNPIANSAVSVLVEEIGAALDEIIAIEEEFMTLDGDGVRY